MNCGNIPLGLFLIKVNFGTILFGYMSISAKSLSVLACKLSISNSLISMLERFLVGMDNFIFISDGSGHFIVEPNLYLV